MNPYIQKLNDNGAVKLIKRAPLILALLLLVMLFFTLEPRFLSERNIYNIFLQISILTPVAIAETLVILTGGMANSKKLVETISEYVSFIAPIKPIPGEHEMKALAEGAIRALTGQEETKTYS